MFKSLEESLTWRQNQQKVVFGFGDIVATATGYITAMGAAPKTKFVGNEATAIADAFRLFVKVHQQLLDIIIGKGGFLTQIPFVGPPIAAVLRSIEGVVDVSCLSFFPDSAGHVGLTRCWARPLHLASLTLLTIPLALP